MVTIHDVAKYANVSISTVSNVLNQVPKVSDSTVVRVEKAIHDLGYIPNRVARDLKKSVTNTIGIVIEDIRDFVSIDTIDGIYEYCEEKNYHINMIHLRVMQDVDESSEDPSITLSGSSSFQKKLDTAIQNLMSTFASGIIYVGRYPRDLSNCFPKLNIPIVFVYCYAKNSQIEKSISISYDDYQGTKMAVDYLVNQGHSKIAIIGGSINTLPTHRRIMGYQNSLMEHSLPLRTEYISSGNWTYQSGYDQFLKLCELHDMPTAILAMSDLMAFGAITAAREKNLRIPDDISIHGFDNNSYTEYFSPPLTTIQIPLSDVGRQAAYQIIKMLEENYVPPQDQFVHLPCVHIERASVKKIL